VPELDAPSTLTVQAALLGTLCYPVSSIRLLRCENPQNPGWAGYALFDWSASLGWQASLHVVRYDPATLHRELLAMAREIRNGSHEAGPNLRPAVCANRSREGIDPYTYPIAAFIANRVRPKAAEAVSEERLDYLRYRWGDAPAWWEERDAVPAWRLLRQGAAPS
jgi:hypothetical protein